MDGDSATLSFAGPVSVLRAGGLRVGHAGPDQGINVVVQNAGLAVFTQISIVNGELPYSGLALVTGSYNLGGSGVLQTSAILLGVAPQVPFYSSGNGAQFNQTGGSTTAGHINFKAGAFSLNLSGGTMNAGQLSMDGSRFFLSGSGVFQADTVEDMGPSSSFAQSGGSNRTTTLSAAGNYTMTAGSLQVLGATKLEGTFSQSGGTAAFGGDVLVYSYALGNAEGDANVTVVGTEWIGKGHAGSSFTQTGGSHQAVLINVGVGAGTTGSQFNFQGGSLNAAQVVVGATGGGGTGLFNSLGGGSGGSLIPVQAVPEPGAWAPWMGGLAALAGLMRRRIGTQKRADIASQRPPNSEVMLLS